MKARPQRGRIRQANLTARKLHCEYKHDGDGEILPIVTERAKIG